MESTPTSSCNQTVPFSLCQLFGWISCSVKTRMWPKATWTLQPHLWASSSVPKLDLGGAQSSPTLHILKVVEALIN